MKTKVKILLSSILSVMMIFGLFTGFSVSAANEPAKCLGIKQNDIGKIEWLCEPGSVEFSIGKVDDLQGSGVSASGNAKIITYDDGNPILADISGNALTVPGKYLRIYPFIGNYAVVVSSEWTHSATFGIIDDTGKEVFNPKYGYITYVSDGLVGIATYDTQWNGIWGFMDINGQWVCGPYKYYEAGPNEYPIDPFYSPSRINDCIRHGIAAVSFGYYPEHYPVILDMQGNSVLSDVAFSWVDVPEAGERIESILWYDSGMLVKVEGIGYGVMKIPVSIEKPPEFSLCPDCDKEKSGCECSLKDVIATIAGLETNGRFAEGSAGITFDKIQKKLSGAKIYDKDSKEITGDSLKDLTLGTGMTIESFNGIEEITVVITNDLSGDGELNIDDAKLLLESFVGNTDLTDAQILAAKDYVDNGKSAIQNLRAFLTDVMYKS